MQTINRNKTSAQDRMIDLLHTPLDAIDLPLLQDALSYLRSTALPELHETVSSAGRSAIDVSGTGGSGVSKFNTSTSVAFVLAAHGVDVIKFGNRSITGNSGSMDFLAALGLTREIAPEECPGLLLKMNVVFLGAQNCYPALGSIREARRKLGRPSIFNFVGPLLNPAFPAFRLLGVSNSHMLGLLNEVIANDGSIRRTITVRSLTGLDELCPFNENIATLIERNESAAAKRELTEFNGCSNPSLQNSAATRSDTAIFQRTGTTAVNAEIFYSIIDGDDKSSPHYEGLILNSAAAFLAADAVETKEAGINLSKSLLAKGLVRLKFNQVRSALS